MGDALVINLVMNGNVGYSRSRGGNDGEDKEPTRTSGTISPACKLFLRVRNLKAFIHSVSSFLVVLHISM
jgi:hypothetical protein